MGFWTELWSAICDGWSYLHAENTVSLIFRIILAAIAGGLIGMERESQGRAAGLRTHMLVAVGAALTATIGVHLSLQMAAAGINSDVQRTGAQVMSGIGFLGAGTILLKKDSPKITGLTTAAGLWTTAAIGLAVGYGFYVGAIATAIVVLLAFTLVSRLEYRMNRNRQRIFVYLELDSVDSVAEMLSVLREQFHALEMHVTPPRSGTASHVGMEVLLRLPYKVSPSEKLQRLGALEHVTFAMRGD
jgi:putative Mg2+ transporter-C (MgtC) family protein